MDPTKLSFDNDYEPLPSNIRDQLQVRGNSYMPLMIHHKSIILPKYLNKNDLVIESHIVPKYFAWTLDRLGIKIPANKELTDT